MKAYLVFKLPQENEEYENAVNGIKYRIVLEDLDDFFRSKVKYENKNYVRCDVVREKISELMNDRGLR